MNKPTKSVSQRLISLAVGTLLVSVVIWVLWEEAPVEQAAVTDAGSVAVTVIEAIPAEARIEVNATGITMARWPTTIAATVSGRVVDVADNTVPGNLVVKDQNLVSLLDTAYQSDVKAASARQAEAELHLAEALNRQYVAKKVDKPNSSFGRYEPHVKAAQANLRAARAALAAAQQQLLDTQIKAPFDCVILRDAAHPGMWINAGDALFQVAASDFLDIKVELPNVSWQRLNGVQAHQNGIRVETPNGSHWQASIRYLSPVMDAVTRQRSIMLQVANPFQSNTPLLADQQVKVTFTGESLSHVVTAPGSVLTEDGKVWSVIDNALKLEDIELLDEQPDQVLFRYKNDPATKRYLVRFPLSTLLEGQSVTTLNL